MTNPQPPDRKYPGRQFLERLRDLERRPVEDLVFYQARRLEILLRHAREQIPFYGDRFGAVFDAGDTLDLSRWQEVPVLSRQEAEQNAGNLKAKMIPAEVGNAVLDRTTGSGGTPFHFTRSMLAAMADTGNSLRIFFDHGFDLKARVCDIRLDTTGEASWPEGKLRKDWTYGTGSGDYALLDINTDLDKQVDWLVRRQPHTLFTWASNARQIALELERTGRSLPLTSIATSAEPCTDAVRTDLRRVFGLEPVDIFGTREIGIIAFACNRSPLYHLAAESAFLEVIGDDGRPAGPGEIGQLVATSLFNFHMPFIRYAVGDYVTLSGQSCPCGRSLPSLSALHGRGRNRFTTADRRSIFPQLPEAELDVLIKPYGWQIAQTGIGRLELRVDGTGPGSLEDEQTKLEGILSRAFGEPVSVAVMQASLQPGPARRKHERFRNETR